MPKELDLTPNQLACVRQVAEHGSLDSPRAWSNRTVRNLRWVRQMIRPRTLGDGPGGDWMLTETGQAALDLATRRKAARDEYRRRFQTRS